MRQWEWEGMGISIIKGDSGMVLYTIMGMGW